MKPPTTLREWAESATKENSVQHEIETRLKLAGWTVFRTDVIHATVDHGERGKRKVRQNTPGDPDLVAVRCRMFTALEVGETLWIKRNTLHLPADVILIETKRPKGGKVSKVQKLRHKDLRERGFTVIVARSYAELEREARKVGLEL